MTGSSAPAPAAPVFAPSGESLLALRVYYQDTDAGGVVYHARYLDFAERGRTELFRALGVPVADPASPSGPVFALRSLQAEWLAPAHVDDLLVVATRPTALSPARLVLAQELRRDGRVLARLAPVLVCLRRAAGALRATRLPQGLCEALSARWGVLPPPGELPPPGVVPPPGELPSPGELPPSGA